jgi:ABC-type multidrug transport system fused ATPase/permease subunit
MYFYNRMLTCISLIVSALTAFVSIKINQSIKKYAKKVQKKSTKLSMLLSDIISGFVTLKMNSGTKVVLNYFYEENEASFQSEKDRVKMEALFEIVAFLLGIIGSFGTIIVGVWLVSEGRVDYGTLMAVVTLQMGVSNAMQRLGSSIAALTTSLVRAGHVFDFMESEMEEEITWFTAGNGLERKNINVPNLHFSYNENDESRDKNKMHAQLNSKKMQISVGEKVMITGESGCGKSTLLKLIQGFYPVENGKIKILGKDINEYSLAELRNVIIYVPQDSYLFEGTIAENIALGWSEETAPVMDVIVSAAKKAHADEFIKDLPEGYNTKVAAGGTNLSGGQRQRISIARAFMKEAPIVLMDEPSSALDTYSENAVLEAMSVFMKKKTVIMVSHRMTGAEKFNRVVRMD